MQSLSRDKNEPQFYVTNATWVASPRTITVTVSKSRITSQLLEFWGKLANQQHL